jgi:hypothetical protein
MQRAFRVFCLRIAKRASHTAFLVCLFVDFFLLFYCLLLISGVASVLLDKGQALSYSRTGHTRASAEDGRRFGFVYIISGSQAR